MLNIPLTHKTVFLFDHASYFASPCGQTYDYDVANKPKPSGSAQQPHQPASAHKLNPLNKTLWTVSIESALEFARIVYDLYPEHKLIRAVMTRSDVALNGWSDAEQSLEHLMTVMGSMVPPQPHMRELFDGEEFLNLCKGLSVAVNGIAQATQLQQSLCSTHKSNSVVPNAGRIILFTAARVRNLEKLQEFMRNAVDECNKSIDQMLKKEKIPASNLRLKMIELVIVDMVAYDQVASVEKEVVFKNSPELRTRIVTARSGSHLPLRMIQLVQNFYELAVTSVTNIPMKEELNANSSANYDVDILHARSLHDQLKICGLLKNCTVQKEGINTVCLRWSNPKTSITDFNFSGCSHRITPIDVNSRPASCLTSFLLSGRCVVLEVANRTNNSNTVRVSSHVLCTHGGEIFMHCLSCYGRSPVDDRPANNAEPTKTDSSSMFRPNEYRISEFTDFIKANTVSRLANLYDLSKPETFSLSAISARIEKSTRNMPIMYTQSFITNLIQLKPLMRNVASESISDTELSECIKCVDFFQAMEARANEQIGAAHLVVPLDEQQPQQTWPSVKRDQFRLLWTELDNFLKAYQDVSDRHRQLYNHVKRIRALNAPPSPLPATASAFSASSARASQSDSSGNAAKKASTVPLEQSKANVAECDHANSEHENAKLSKRRKFIKEFHLCADEFNLLDFWLNTVSDSGKRRTEFNGRLANPIGTIAPLYINLKMDEGASGTGVSKNSGGAKMEIG